MSRRELIWLALVLISHSVSRPFCWASETFQNPQFSAEKPPAAKADASVCVVVRTYWGHGRHSKTGLKQLLQSIERQSHTNWEVVIIVLDAKPFRDLALILDEVGNTRIWVYAEWIGKQYTPKSADGFWADSYHGILYDLTDEAVRACPSSTRWVLITNGDNEYASSAFSTVVQREQADIVAFDFYSRYQRVTGPRCERFSRQPGLPHCKPNGMRWCHTDLGANAMNWQRLVDEDRKFGTLHDSGMGADNLDGLMAASLVQAGWQVEYLRNTCSFEHDPSPQRCAQIGGVWDDTLEGALDSPGGDCITPAAADAILSEGGVEEFVIPLSHDGRLHEFQAPGFNVSTEIRCLRNKDTGPAMEYAQGFFGDICAAEFDLTAS